MLFQMNKDKGVTEKKADRTLLKWTGGEVQKTQSQIVKAEVTFR